jgi:hypothetical protein
MPKKKLKQPTEEVIKFNGVVYNSKFINYDESEKIISITSVSEGPNSLEIDINLIPNFISFKKNYINYTVDYFKKIKEGLISDEDEIDKIIRSEYVFYQVDRNNVTNDVTIIHDRRNKKWIVEFSEVIPKDSTFTFYVTKKSNKNYLLSSYSFNTSEKVLIFDFRSEHESILENIDILVYKKYKNYGLKELI